MSTNPPLFVIAAWRRGSIGLAVVPTMLPWIPVAPQESAVSSVKRQSVKLKEDEQRVFEALKGG